jgi:hypothetical protein
MHVAPNEKYAAFFMSRCAVGADIPDEAEIGPRIWVSRTFGIEAEDHWREWLGSVVMDEMAKEGLAVYVTAPSEHPEVLDAVNAALSERVNDTLNGLLLQGIPPFERGILVSGANANGTVGIRQHSSFRDLYPLAIQRLSARFVVGRAELVRSLSLARLVRSIQSAPRPEWGRLIRAVSTLLKANHETNLVGDRLHQLVRSLEGLIKPRIGQSRDDFAHRGQTIALANVATRDILLELYDLRSAVEHLNDPIDALPPGGTEQQRRDRINQRTRQAEALARFAVLKVLESAEMFTAFRSDASMDTFWSLQDHERLALWGSRIDIVALQ